MSIEWVYPLPMDGLDTSLAGAACGTSEDECDVARFQAGEQSAFESLVRRHERAVYRLSLRMLRHPEDAMDATQEIFLRTFRGLPSFRGEAAFRTWLYGIALNVCRTRGSATARREYAAESLDRTDEEREGRPLRIVKDPSPDPAEQVLGGELFSALRAALSKVSAEHREILLLREVEQLDYADLSSLLGVPEGTVKSRLARARRALREAMEGIWP
ncbi:MAG: RNA polymerase sigma factor [Acidobacteriota bacterium]